MLILRGGSRPYWRSAHRGSVSRMTLTAMSARPPRRAPTHIQPVVRISPPAAAGSARRHRRRRTTRPPISRREPVRHPRRRTRAHLAFLDHRHRRSPPSHRGHSFCARIEIHSPEAIENPGHSVVRLAGLAASSPGGSRWPRANGSRCARRRSPSSTRSRSSAVPCSDSPVEEREELRAIFEARGIEAELADRLATDLMRDPDLALRTHAREELGVDPSATGNPWAAAISSFIAFCVGALIPLLPWLVTTSGNLAWWSSASARSPR